MTSEYCDVINITFPEEILPPSPFQKGAYPQTLAPLSKRGLPPNTESNFSKF